MEPILRRNISIFNYTFINLNNKNKNNKTPLGHLIKYNRMDNL